MANRRAQGGFTLVEILITLTLVTVLSVVALNALTPWLTFKQALDTDSKLQDMRQGLTAMYTANAVSIENVVSAAIAIPGATLTNDTATTGSACTAQVNAVAAMSSYLTESGVVADNDGYASPFCFLITPRLTKAVEGVQIYYHVLAVVSTGRNGVLDSGTTLNAATGQLTLAGDDKGVVINGYNIEYAKYRDTLDRLNRIGTLYENYFTTRFTNTSDRDTTRDYFYNGSGTNGDANGSVAATTGWTPALTVLSTSLGVSPLDATTTFDNQSYASNNVELGNTTEAVTLSGSSTSVRSPANLATGATPPYTALLRARLAGGTPGAGDNFVVRVVVGSY